MSFKIVQPCSLVMEAMMHTSGVQSVALTVEEFIVKVSHYPTLFSRNPVQLASSLFCKVRNLTTLSA